MDPGHASGRGRPQAGADARRDPRQDPRNGCNPFRRPPSRRPPADHGVDYTQEDFTRSEERYDLTLDIAGSRSWSEYKRVLDPLGTLVIVGGPKSNRLLGPLGHAVAVRLAAVRSSRKVAFFIAKFNKPDLEILRELLETGRVTTVIARRSELSEIADAFRYIGEGHAKERSSSPSDARQAACDALRQDLARVHDPVRVEHLLQPAHQINALLAVLQRE